MNEIKLIVHDETIDKTQSYLRKLDDEVNYWRQRAGWYDDDIYQDDDAEYNNRVNVRIANSIKNLGLTKEILVGILGIVIVALFIRVVVSGSSRDDRKRDRGPKRQSSSRRGRSMKREWDDDDMVDAGYDDYFAMEERSVKSSRSKKSKKSKRSRSKSKRSSTRSLRSSSKSRRSSSKSRRSSSKSRRSSSKSRRPSSKSKKSMSQREMLV